MVEKLLRNFYGDNFKEAEYMQTTTIILAGGKIEEDLAARTKEKAKAFIKINGKYMVEYVVEALRGSEKIKEIILVSDLNITPGSVKEKVDKCVQSGSNMIETLLKGVDAAAAHYDNSVESVLVVPCDMPLIDKHCAEEFLDNARALYEQKNARIIYGIVEKQNYIRKFPAMKRTYLKLKDGAFCGTGFFYMDREVVKNLKSIFEKISGFRKKPWQAVSMLGFFTIIKLLTRQLTIKDLEEKAEKFLGCASKTVVLRDPVSAVNVDSVEDLIEVEKILK